MPITKYGLLNAIDTCRIFEASYDFWDETGDGWRVLRLMFFSYGIFPEDVEATLHFLLWLIQSSSPDIKVNYHMNQVIHMIRSAGLDLADAVSLLLELSPTAAVDKTEESPYDELFLEERDKSAFLDLMVYQLWDSVRLLIKFGAYPHYVYTNHVYSSVAETPLSLAMYSSWSFWAFRNFLREIDLDVEDIARQELKQGSPLLDAGWQMETLRALLELEFEPGIEPPRLYPYIMDRKCDKCCFHITHIAVQPYWQCIVESIKNGTYQEKSCSDTQDEQTSNSRSYLSITSEESLASITDESILAPDPALLEDQTAQTDEEPPTSRDNPWIPDRNEIWCPQCWHHYKETGRRWSPATTETEFSDGDDSSDDGYSPLLFNT